MGSSFFSFSYFNCKTPKYKTFPAYSGTGSTERGERFLKMATHETSLRDEEYGMNIVVKILLYINSVYIMCLSSRRDVSWVEKRVLYLRSVGTFHAMELRQAGFKNEIIN
jgi:hypothetical protein